MEALQLRSTQSHTGHSGEGKDTTKREDFLKNKQG